MKTLLQIMTSILFLLFCILEYNQNRKQRAIIKQKIDSIRTTIKLIEKINAPVSDPQIMILPDTGILVSNSINGVPQGKTIYWAGKNKYEIDQKETHLKDGDFCLMTTVWRNWPNELLVMNLVYDGYDKNELLEYKKSYWRVKTINDSVKHAQYELAERFILRHRKLNK